MGRIRSLQNKTRKGTRLIKANLSNGYLMVNLHRDGQRSYCVHKLVATAFFGESKLTVNHKNRIRTDNRVINLELLSQRENVIHYKSQVDRGGLPTGVHSFRNKFKAAISVNGKLRYLGLFTDPLEAGRAYEKAKREALQLL